ncbi:MAG: hypothetical protein K8R60_01460 [Burkholderiales bacterium]|nr:hypothetical protein [Burkholderiales bacterium]
MAAWLLAGLLAAATPAVAQDAAAMRSKHAASQDKFATNQFGRPLVLESTQTSGDLRGDVYTIVDHPFATAQQALRSVENWCDILILHLNVKRCRPGANGKSIALNVGRKFDQPLEDSYELEFDWRLAAATPEYLSVQLSAEEGPLSTRNYRIQVEAVPIDARHSMIHMSYAYGYGFAARMAMQTYLSTLGRNKVGFSITGRNAEGKPIFIGGVLGLLERNTMRYYLAIDAYLNSYASPPAEQFEKRIREWYGSTERYAPQLHEMEQNDYLEMKRKEMKRQQQG